MFLFNNLIF